MTKIIPTGVTMMAVCEVNTDRCIARKLAPITAVFTELPRTQINVCRPCFEEQMRTAEWLLEGTHPSRQADVAAYDATGKIVLVVEVKKYTKRGTPPSEGWAENIFQQLSRFGAVPNAKYFMLVAYPTRCFFWSDTSGKSGPDVIANMDPALRIQKSDEDVTHNDIEEVVSNWLRGITHDPGNAGHWLESTGLPAAIAGGTVATEIAADHI